MKKILVYLMAIVMAMNLSAQVNGTIQWNPEIDFTYQVNGEYIEISSETGYIDEPGMPQIPYCMKTFLIPVNAEAAIQVKSVNRKLQKKDVLLYPVQPPIPIGESSSSWVEPNSDIYNSSNPFPGKYAEIISDRMDFGYHLVTVRFYPIEYIPKQRELYTCDIAYTLTFSMVKKLVSTSIIEKQSEYLSQLDKDYIRSIIENKEMLTEITPNVKASFRKGRLGAMVNVAEKKVTSDVDNYLPEYLIITNEALKEKFRILADWKTKKGVPAIIETIEEISATYAGSDIQEKIRNYLIDIKRKYGSMFVLLGGDTNVIPARVKKSRYSKNKDWVAIDFYYTCVESGNWNKNGNNVYFESDTIDFDDDKDWGVSFKLGRAPVETLEEAEIFVNKVIHYEKADLNINYSYINNSVAADAFISKNENTDYLFDEKRSEIANFYSETNLNRWLIYDHYNCKSNIATCSNKHSIYEDQSGKGEELNKANFVSALQNGGNSGLNHFHLVYHMDHSSAGGMGTSSKDKNESISNWDVDNLNNGYYYQIVMSGGCSPADITKDCIAEHFVNNPQGGAVAFIGNTDTGWSDEHVHLGQFLSELYKTSANTTNRYDLSILHQKAIENINYDKLELANCALHLFGDPEMQVWSDVPKAMDITLMPVSLTTGENMIMVNINGLPQNETARICIQKGDELYYVDQLGNGSHSIGVFIQTLGVVNVTVTAHNFRPVERDIQVLQNGSEPAIAVEDLIYNDKGTGASIGNGDGQLDAGETIELTVKLRNTGTSVLNGVTASLVSTSNDIEIVNANATFGNIAGNAVVGSITPLVFKINKDSGEHLRNNSSGINLNLQISVNGETKTQPLKIDNIYAPEIEIGNQKITWTSNGNTTVEAGETVKMNIDLMNIGRAEAIGLKAVLISNNIQASCPSTQVAYPSIPFTETKTNTVALQFQTSGNYTGILSFTLQVSNKYGKKWNFPVNPLLRPAMIDVSTIKSQIYSTSINVYWTSMGESISYNVYRSDNGENGTYKKLNKFPLTATYYLDENLAKLTKYHYKVTAILNNGNESEWSTAYQTWTSYPVVSPFPRRITTGNYSAASCPNIVDVDNDGKQEIFWCYSDFDSRIGYLAGFRPTGEELFDIDGNVTTVSGFAKTSAILKGQVAFGDLFGIGEQNIVVSSWDDTYRDRNTVYCYSPFDKDGDHKPDLLWEKKISYSMYQSPVIANLDGSSDGTMEVLIKSHQTPDIFILDHNGDELRRLNPNANITSKKDYNYSALTVADLDDDGQMEIIASYDSLGIYIWRQDGRPFTTNPFWRAGDINLASAPVVCDLNGDGKKEILFSQHQVHESHVFAISLEGDKTVAGWDGSQTIPYTVNVKGSTLDHTLSVGDINNDGYLEVVILGHEMIKAWKHTGDTIFSRHIDGLFPQENYAANVNTPILADVDGDGIPDIVFCCNKYIYALHNDGSDIVGFPIVSDYIFQETPCVADIDNDGKNELIASDEKDLYVWKTDGIPTAIEWGVNRGNPQNTGEYFPTVCKPMLINANETWNGESPCGNVVLQSGHLVVPGGKTMTLNNTSAVIVRSGATLEVDGGSILNARLVVQKGGTVVVKNNGLIKLRSGAEFEMENGAVLDLPCGAIDVP